MNKYLLLFGALFTTMFFACKKHESITTKVDRRTLEDSATLYSKSDVAAALSDVTVSNGHLVFNNLNHLQIVLYALDSLGDSASYAWENSIGFTSLKKLAADDDDQYGVLVDNAATTETDITNFKSNHANTLVITDDEIQINASDPTIAWALASDHKLYVNDYTIYSDFNNFISLPTANESDITTLVASSESATDDSRNSILYKINRSTGGGGTGDCFTWQSNTTQYRPDITCGSPLAYKTTYKYNFVNYAYKKSGVTNVVIKAEIEIHNYKRAGGGKWKSQKRGSQVSGTFGFGSLFVVNFSQSKIGSNNQADPTYTVWELDYANSLPPAYAEMFTYNFCFNGQLCTSPMCDGNTMCVTL